VVGREPDPGSLGDRITDLCLAAGQRFWEKAMPLSEDEQRQLDQIERDGSRRNPSSPGRWRPGSGAGSSSPRCCSPSG